ncbi:MAG: M48 family metallopeptidase [Crocinitomicaceae bacterium]|nr:M48 family metallopeptidase [Crocinitomicaceae bacterium]
MNYLLSLLSLLFVGFSINAQTDFNEYKTLQSEGRIPADFTVETYAKIEEGLEEGRNEIGSQYEQRKFLEQTGYAIDELLHSGLVVFGDPLSNYVTKVANKLLKNDRKLKEKLRFYTLKTNNTNAFSTDQGIIFVTSGLVSQLTSEAQLAFILAHEISHYTEKHVVETFTWKKNKKFRDDWIGQMSIYSKEKEFDADRIAVDMYRKAGYSKEEIVPTFDVLLYSYLPFDEVDISLDYFSTDLMYLHPMLFPKKEYEIKANEEEDDSKSSHPNIKKRKTAAQETIDGVKGAWETNKFQLGKDRFYEIRNIARFESIRTDIMNAQYGNAIYSIYLLEKDFPESIYLKRMKAQAWLGLYQFEKAGKISSTLKNKSDYEGQSAKVHYMLRKLNRSSLTTIALRNVYDIKQENPDDEEVAAIYDFMVKELGFDKKFNLDDYYPMTFIAAIDSNRVRLEKKKIMDTNTIVTEKPVVEKKSKYDRIKTKKIIAADPVSTIDSLRYYNYGISDILLDESFTSDLKTHQEKFAIKEELKEEYKQLSLREKQQLQKEQKYDHLKIGIQEVISVEPRVFTYSRKGVDNVKSEQLELRFSESMRESAELAGMELFNIDSRSIQQNGATGFNERTALISCLRQVGNESKVNPFPVDFLYLKNLQNNFGTKNVMFSIVEHSYQPDFDLLPLLGAIYFFPLAPFYISSKVMKGNQTNLTIIVLDINTGQVISGETYYYNEGINRHNLGARMYNIFQYLSSTPQ